MDALLDNPWFQLNGWMVSTALLALGIAVFSGMLGVTFFGIFLTPVFYYLLQLMTGRRSPPANEGPTAATAHGSTTESHTPDAVG